MPLPLGMNFRTERLVSIAENEEEDNFEELDQLVTDVPLPPKFAKFCSPGTPEDLSPSSEIQEEAKQLSPEFKRKNATRGGRNRKVLPKVSADVQSFVQQPHQQNMSTSTSEQSFKVHLYNLPETVSTKAMMRLMLQEVEVWSDVSNLSMQPGEAIVTFRSFESVEKCIAQFNGRTCLMSGFPIVAMHVPPSTGPRPGKKRIPTKRIAAIGTTEKSMTSCELEHLRACVAQTMNWHAYSSFAPEWQTMHGYPWAQQGGEFSHASYHSPYPAPNEPLKVALDSSWAQVNTETGSYPDSIVGA
jgi:hypothetical protein